MFCDGLDNLNDLLSIMISFEINNLTHFEVASQQIEQSYSLVPVTNLIKKYQHKLECFKVCSDLFEYRHNDLNNKTSKYTMKQLVINGFENNITTLQSLFYTVPNVTKLFFQLDDMEHTTRQITEQALLSLFVGHHICG